MSALELASVVTELIYAVVFVIAARTVLRHLTRANVDTAIFYLLAAVGGAQVLFASQGTVEFPLLRIVSGAAFLALPYVLVRVLGNFSVVLSSHRRLIELGLGASALGFLFASPRPLLVIVAVSVYFLGAALYAGLAFVRASAGAHTVTARRLQAVATGALLLGASGALGGLAETLGSDVRSLSSVGQQVLALSAAVAFAIGFAPPRALWRAWQEPELRAFLARAARLPWLPTAEAMVRALEDGAAASTGGAARIGLVDQDQVRLRYTDHESGAEVEVDAGLHIGGRAFSEQRAVFSMDRERDDPYHVRAYPEGGSGAVMAAPVTAGEQRLGVLVVFATRPPLFADMDLDLVRLLADNAALMLETRAVLDEAAQVRAHEEAARLKEEFLSAAAHDLKTPLTALVMQTQLMERKAARDPAGPADRAGLERIVREANRLRALTIDFLDASRLGEGAPAVALEPVDLADAAREVCARKDQARCVVEAGDPVVGRYDRVRIDQLFENLVENALRYSPGESVVRVRVWENGEARLAVEDVGIGIPHIDLPHVFERFRRGSNVREQRFSGTGLGLYICREIVQAHGGRIWVESRLGQGSSFHVSLPLPDRDAVPLPPPSPRGS